MAIFGQNGLSAAALYVATLFALYGQKNAGFPNKAALSQIQSIMDRKSAAKSGKKGEAYKAEVAKLRRGRYEQYLAAGKRRTGAAGEERYAELTSSGKFATEHVKLGYLR